MTRRSVPVSMQPQRRACPACASRACHHGPMRASGTSPATAGRHEHYDVRVLRADEHAAAAGAAARALQDDPASIACYGDEPLVRLARTHGLFLDLFARLATPQYGALAGTAVVGVAG